MIKKILCLLLAGLMLVSTVSCATSGEETQTQESGQTVVGTVAETEEKPDLPELDYKGEAFRILTDKTSYSQLVAATTNGEVLNDAILEATMSVTNQFNIKFAMVEGDGTTIETFVLAGDDEYDMKY